MKTIHLAIMVYLGISIFISGIAYAPIPPSLILTNSTESSSSYHVDVPIPPVVYWLVLVTIACGGISIVILKKK